jgi:type II secretory pathway pseudopilin PulG
VRLSRRAGFTILEILIALVVLGVSVLGVLALLVTSTKVAGEVVEDTFASTLARSIYESARIAARERGFAVTEPDPPNPDRVVRGFVLTERGMSNTVPAPGQPLSGGNFTPPALPAGPGDTAALAPLRASDFTIFLPNDRDGTTGPAGGNAVFVFPRPNGAATDNAGRGANNARTDGAVDQRGQVIPLLVTRTYQLSHHPGSPLITGPQTLSKEAADQYSFIIAVRQTRVPRLVDAAGKAPTWQDVDFVPDLSVAGSTELSNGLYYFEVQVFRNFTADPTDPDHMPLPKGRFMGLLAVGP